MPLLRACSACGLVHAVGNVPPRHRAVCTRCGGTIRAGGHPRAPARAAAFALAALLLYPAAMGLPIMTLTRLGHEHETTIWAGMVSLIAEGQIAVGLVVLFCSVVAPVLKLAAIFSLSAGELLLPHRARAATYRLVEFLGRWGMLDVVLISLLVASVKLGDVVEVKPGPGVAAFAAVVVLSLLASAFFDPHAIWDRGQPQRARGAPGTTGGLPASAAAPGATGGLPASAEGHPGPARGALADGDKHG